MLHVVAICLKGSRALKVQHNDELHRETLGPKVAPKQLSHQNHDVASPSETRVAEARALRLLGSVREDVRRTRQRDSQRHRRRVGTQPQLLRQLDRGVTHGRGTLVRQSVVCVIQVSHTHTRRYCIEEPLTRHHHAEEDTSPSSENHYL